MGANISGMYEVEFKVEITKTEREDVIKKLLENNFLDGGSTSQLDCYIEAKESPYGGFDTKRFRQEGDKFIYTEKIWELMDGEMIRREEEKEVSEEEFLSGINSTNDSITIKKDRQKLDGFYDGYKLHVDMDTVKFDHSVSERYFLETEILTDDKAQVKELREFIHKFLVFILDRDDVVEASGMFSMAFLKL